MEQRVSTGSPHTVPAIHNLFTRNELEWMASSVGPWSEEMVREFYDSYVEALGGSLDMRANLTNQSALTYVRVRGGRVNISPTICRFLYNDATDGVKVPAPQSFTTGATWSRMAIFSRIEI